MDHRSIGGPSARGKRATGWGLVISACLAASSGCWAPLHYRGIPADSLSDAYRTPWRTAREPVNYACLSIGGRGDYILGPGDILEVNVNGLYPGDQAHPVRAQVLESGDVTLPVVGAVQVGGMNIGQANVAITAAFADGFIKDSRVNVTVAEKATTGVVVLGAVEKPGVYPLSKNECDVAHALAAAGGLHEDAGDVVEIHRRITAAQLANAQVLQQLQAGEGGAVRLKESGPEQVPPGEAIPTPAQQPTAGNLPSLPALGGGMCDGAIVKIPLRGFPCQQLGPDAIALRPGDVLVVPHRTVEVFYVVGKLSTNNTVRFSLNVKEREIGAGFVLPANREIDVVSAVAMAGYIDPIDSPTTVTVQRTAPDGTPMLILVDLIKARYDRRATVLIQPGDIVYLNPDLAWWGRRTIDTLIKSLNFGVRFTHVF